MNKNTWLYSTKTAQIEIYLFANSNGKVIIINYGSSSINITFVNGYWLSSKTK